MKQHRAYLPALVLGTILTACEGVLDPPNGFDHSIATPACGPADEAYTAIILAGEPITEPMPRAPYLHLQVPAAFNQLRRDQTWEIGEYPSGSTAWLYRDETSSFIMTASSGEIRIRDVSANEIEGTLDVKFPNGERFRGRFDAAWQDRQTRCG